MPRIKKQVAEVEKSKTSPEETVRYMNQQVDSIDHLIADLLHGVDFDELKCKERIDLVIKLMAHQARVLVLRQSWGQEKSGAQDQRLMAALMSKMRGEVQGEVRGEVQGGGQEMDDHWEGE